MKVVLKESVLELIHKRIIEAKRARREVDYVAVSEQEFMQLRQESPYGSPYKPECYDMSFAPSKMPEMATFKTRNFQRKNSRYVGDYYTVRREGTVFGFDLFVVPDFCEY